MSSRASFRPATIEDAALFWDWRVRAELKPWYGGQKTTRAQHDAWFRDRLGRITLLVWNSDGMDLGVVRVDSNGELAFDSTHPRSMLREFLAMWRGGRLKAVLDREDWRKARALEAVGFVEFPARAFCYRP